MCSSMWLNHPVLGHPIDLFNTKLNLIPLLVSMLYSFYTGNIACYIPFILPSLFLPTALSNFGLQHISKFYFKFSLTTPMKQSPSWEANSSPASPENPHILWNPKAYIHAPKSLQLVPITSQIYPIFYRPILILSSFPCLHIQSGLIPSGFPTKASYAPLPSLAHLILLDLITPISLLILSLIFLPTVLKNVISVDEIFPVFYNQPILMSCIEWHKKDWSC